MVKTILNLLGFKTEATVTPIRTVFVIEGPNWLCGPEQC